MEYGLNTTLLLTLDSHIKKHIHHNILILTYLSILTGQQSADELWSTLCPDPLNILHNQATKILINLILVAICLLLLIGWLSIQTIQRRLTAQEKADYVTMVL